MQRIILLSILFSFLLIGKLHSQTQATGNSQSIWLDMMLNDDNKNFNEIQNSFNNYWQGRTRQPGDGWKVFKRWENYWSTRVNADGSFPANNSTLKAYSEMMASGGPLASTTGTWTSIGPNSLPTNTSGQLNGVGRINCVAFHPTNASIIYVGAPAGGLWKTIDGGINWTCLTNNMPTLGVSSILINPSTPNTIFIGTGDADANDAPGMGVYKTTDGGATWVASNTGITTKTVSKLVFGANTNTIFAATSGGVYRSTNGGTTWIIKSVVGNFRDITFKPASTTIIHATSYSNSTGAKYYRSMNGGNNWSQITTGLTATGYRMVIGVSPANSNLVYLVAGNANGLVAVYKSTNGGTSFANVYSSKNILGRDINGGGTSSQAWYDLAVAVSPSNANIIHVGGINIWKSTNGGSSWSLNAYWLNGHGVPGVHADHHCLAYSPSGVLYNGNDGGFSKTSNGGTTWTDITGNMVISQIYKIGQSASTLNSCMAGFQDNGTAKQTAVNAWSTVIGGDGMECLIDPTNDSYKYGALYYGDVRRSVNGSYYSTVAENGTNGINEDGAWVTPYLLAESNANIMFVGYKNIWRSTNIKASTTSAVNFYKKSNFSSSLKVSVLENSPVNSNILYAVKGSGTLYRSDNALATNPTWTNLGTIGGTITDLEAHPTIANTVYATAGGNVYKSTNKGASWTSISGNLPSGSKNCLVYDTTSNEGIYVGTDLGIFYKDASMANWLNFSAGMPVAAEVTELEIYYGATSSASYIKAATYGRGVWMSDLYSNVSTPITVAFQASNTNACSGLVVNFTDNTSPTATSWNWTITPSTYTFVNNTSASSQNPSIKFNTAGSYTIKLVAGNASSIDSLTKPNYINVGNSSSGQFVEDFSTFITGDPGTWFNGWTYSNNGIFNWRVNNGPTVSNNTGPSADNTLGSSVGKYIYSEASQPAVAGEVASAISPCYTLGSSGSYVLKFYYHMYGATIPGLHVDVYSNGSWINNVYQLTGPQHSSSTAAWTQASVSLNSYLGSTIKIRFRVIRGSDYQGDVAIDDIFIGIVGAPIADFSANIIDPAVGNSVNFTDNSTGNPTTWNWSFTPNTVSYANNTSSSSQNPEVVFNNVGNYDVKLVCSNASGIDSIIKASYISVAASLSIPATEDFESFTLGSSGSTLGNGWNSTTNGTFNWLINAGSTPSSNTGPNVDHTTGTVTGQYIFTEASGISTADEAVLISPFYDFSNSSNPRISYWYHMFGQDITYLALDVFYNGSWVLNANVIYLQQQSSSNSVYQNAIVNLDAYANSIVRFRWRVIHQAGNANSTYRCDVAIDDFAAYNYIPLVNDEPCGAVNLPVNINCNYQTYTNVAATSSVGIPAPGCGGAISEDVWFSVVIPASGSVIIDADPSPASYVDGAMAAYSGSCNSLSLVACNDDYQGSGTMPHIVLNNQTPGDTIFVRFWKYGGGTGDFKLCVSQPPFFVLSPNITSITYSAGTATINGTASPNVTWTVSDNASWLTLSPTTVTGSGTVTLNYSTNSGPLRTAIITGVSAGLPNRTVSVVQDGYITADFTFTSSMLCVNDVQAFTNTSTNANSSIWYVDGVQQATTTNFNHTFTTLGIHIVKLKIIGSLYNDSISKNIFVSSISTANAGTDISVCEGSTVSFNNTSQNGVIGCNTNCSIPTYCNMASQDDNQEYITQVKVNTIINNSLNQGAGYQDFSQNVFAPINLDSTYNLTIRCYTAGSWVEYVDVFVDWNRNGAFDEAAISLGSATFAGFHDFVGFLVPPANAVLGKTKMRVVMKYSQPISGGCENGFGYGEVEDYMIEIVDNGVLNHSWSGPNSFTSTTVSPIINNVSLAQGGDYTLTVSNAYGCTSSDTVNVFVEAYPNVNVANIPDVCQGSADITLTQGTPSGGTYSGTYVTNGVFSPSASGVGTFDIIYSYTNATGCSNSDTNTITVNSLPTVSFSGLSSSICVNAANVILTGQPSGGTFTGTGIEMTNQFNPSLAGVGITQVVYNYTDANSCSSSSSQSVVVNSTPVVNAGNDTTINYNTTAYLHGQSNLLVGVPTYSWSPASFVVNSNLSSTNTVVLTSSKEFTLLVSDNSTSCSDSDKVMVSITGGPLGISVTSANSSVCVGDSTQLLAIASGGVGTITYAWTANGNSLSTTVYNPKVEITQNTWFRVAATDNNTTLYDSVFVSASQLPVVDFSIISDVCEGSNPVNMTNMLPSGGSFTGMGVSANTFDPIVAGVGIHSIQYLYTDANGCTGSKSKDINVNANPSVTIPSQPSVCNSSQTVTLSGGTPYGGTYSGVGVSGVIFNPSTAGVGSHTIYYSFVDQNTCTGIDSATIIVSSSPIADAGSDQTVALNGSVSLLALASGGSGNYSFQWTPTNMVVSSNTAATNTVALSSSQLFKVKVTDSQTQCNDSDNVLVVITGVPLTADINIAQNPVCSGDSVELTAIPTGGNGSYTYSWTTSPGSFTSTLQNPKVAPTVTTAFMVQISDGTTTASDGKFVIVDAAPTSILPVDTAVCDNSSIELDAGGGYAQYLWSNGSNSRKLTVDGSLLPIGNTNFYVTITNANGCSSDDSVNVLLNPSPKNVLGNDTFICQQQTITLDGGNNMASYLWSTNATTQTIDINGNMGFGNFIYWVESTTNEGCVGIDSIALEIMYCSSIFDQENDNFSVIVYPNPNNGDFIIDINSDIKDKVKLSIFDSQGRLVNSDNMDISIGDNSKKISLKSLSQGMYIIYLKGENIYSVRKLIIR